MKKFNKNLCTHPKNKVASYTDEVNNVYIERCLKCTRTIASRKFPVIKK